jgi:hypothetical protein
MCFASPSYLRHKGESLGRVFSTGGRSMKRKVLGWYFVSCGWLLFIAALACPALDVTGGLDYFFTERKIGVTCLRDTFVPFNWIFAPPLFFYMIANLLMFASLGVVAVDCRPIRRNLGYMLLMCYPMTLTAPWCASDVTKALLGCWLWMLSFPAAGLGMVFISGDERHERNRHIEQ